MQGCSKGMRDSCTLIIQPVTVIDIPDLYLQSSVCNEFQSSEYKGQNTAHAPECQVQTVTVSHQCFTSHH